jgi:hypothetical protein
MLWGLGSSAGSRVGYERCPAVAFAELCALRRESGAPGWAVLFNQNVGLAVNALYIAQIKI